TRKKSASSGGGIVGKKSRPDNNNDCPIHGSTHKWGQCFDNRYGENYKPAASTSSSSTASKDKKTAAKGKKDAHALQKVDKSEEEENYFCQECQPETEEPYDLHFFDASIEI
ncbi:MAG: hypothetical protein ACREOZ_01765, partial [Gloeomargaritales cyanobacterium]